MTYKEYHEELLDRLKKVYTEDESQAYLARIISAASQGSKNDWLYIFPELEVPASVIQKIDADIQLVLSGYPIQYVEEVVPFAGLEIAVNSSVLIPRPETEELAAIVKSDILYPPARILDIGTGSGVLALALKNFWPLSEVFAWDVSEDALSIAQQNAERNSLSVHFEIKDILGDHGQLMAPMDADFFDIIISNPPYVLESEKSDMSVNVLEYEPHIALFVSDEDGDVFYRAIIDLAAQILKPTGKVYLECNPKTIQQVREYATQKKFQTHLMNDMFGMQRFLVLSSFSDDQ